MTSRAWMMLGALIATAALAVAVSARRLASASARLDSAQAVYAAVEHDAREVLELRSRQQVIQLRQRPTQDVIAQVNAVLADAGVPASRFKSLTPESESAVSPATANASDKANVKQQSLRLALENLSLAELGGFVNQWSQTQQTWTVTRLELAHVRSASSSNYDVTFVLTALYLADS